MELKQIINEIKRRPCKSGFYRKNGICIKLSMEQKRARKKYSKISLKQRIKDAKRRAKVDCKDGFIKYKKNGKFKCVKKKECRDGYSFSPSKRKCLKVFKH